ncbi:Crp/Fnr family transcriptional regulator [Reichenbachiella carrageenanivorans]|uniref:Crp/Fnr family transcriptional regulator n=1 Tax=Reichenbachiella carrageenanivorans TaxID=2979869 RepID=A0ABY6CYN0_9BACT|nr:Crp/Fnr family transcriptional regulator [Reichenbachiella carrageenanivorans]UXX79012.1 Crp/Fnr family transcriptional regulator [Reichenbachiella carrageenanivorans]
MNLISPISDNSWKDILSIFKKTTLEKGDYFAKVGRVENQFGILLDGVLRAYITNGNGSEYTKTLFTPTHFKTPISYVGALTSLVTMSPNQVSIQALTPSEMLTGNYLDWKSLMDHNQEIATWSRKMTELFFIGKELREFEYFTLHADERYKLFRMRYPELENLITQYQIAHFLGITPTQLSRIRKKIFRED